MSVGFWKKLKKPILALAPMANVTDAAFRRIIAKYGKPDVMFTEFVSADGLCSEGKEKLLIDLSYREAERPIVAQLFSGNPEKMFEAAKIAAGLGFDGVDINMGCPDRSIEKSGAGAVLMKNSILAREIIRAAKRGAANLPVSIKTRLGYSKDSLDEWLPELLAEKPAAITIHARTRKEMSNAPARWDRIKHAVLIRNAFFSSPPSRGGNLMGGGSQTLILGNGDVMSVGEAKQKAAETGADGIMLGKAIFGQPELFSNSHELENSSGAAVAKRLTIMLEHAKLFEELFTGRKNFAIMKKHFKAYVTGFDRAKWLRMNLMETENASDVQKIVNRFLA